MNPGQDSGQVHGADLWPQQSIENDSNSQEEHQRLHAASEEAMGKNPADEWQPKEVERKTIAGGSLDTSAA